MPQNLIAAPKLWFISAYSGTFVANAVTTLSLQEQLNQTQPFLHLQLPIWIFYSATAILAVVGAIASLYTDTMQTSIVGRLKNIFMGFLVGLVSAFVILPVATTKPSVELMMFTSLVLSFSGTVLLHIVGAAMRSTEANNGISATIFEIASVVKDRLLAAFRALFGGDK